MRLFQLAIKNFRKIEKLTITFPAGLCVLVGENNSGKTAIIDALRLILLSGRDFDTLRLNDEDFRHGSNYAPIEMSCTFTDASEEEEASFLECLVDKGDGQFEIRLNLRAEFNLKTGRVNVKQWGGETEGGVLPSNLYDRIAAIYLQPLRDPESGLRPGRYSQVSRLLENLTTKNDHAQFVEIVQNANDDIKKLKPVKRAQKDINSHMRSIAGKHLTQQVELIFNEPEFHRIIAGLKPEIEGLPFTFNGLGYNNLIFTAMTLGTLKTSSQFLFRSILVEEPEAHLHPQLQTLLLQHFAKVAQKNPGQEAVQVIATSHSPVLVSQAPLDSIVAVHEHDDRISATSICSIGMPGPTKRKLQRFLDATRSELFFARRLIMVEGISEALLLPILTEKAGGNLKDSAVTILNADGLNFNAFLPLFEEGQLELPVAILTDGDADKIGGDLSASLQKLLKISEQLPSLKVFHSNITFEHELARWSVMRSLMLDAFEKLHKRKAGQLKENIATLKTGDEKADAFYEAFIDAQTSKGAFAQELATLLEEYNGDKVIRIPKYIQNALEFLDVITPGGPNG